MAVEVVAEDAVEDEVLAVEFVEDVEPETSSEFVGNGHAWSYVPETSTDLQLDATEPESVQRPSADDDADRWAEAAAAIDADAAPAEQKRRGLFRRRKPVSVEPVAFEAGVADDEPEFAFDSSQPADEPAGDDRSWSYVTEDSTFAHDEHEPSVQAYEPDEVVTEHVEAFPEPEPVEVREEDEPSVEFGDEWAHDEEIAAIAEVAR